MVNDTRCGDALLLTTQQQHDCSNDSNIMHPPVFHFASMCVCVCVFVCVCLCVCVCVCVGGRGGGLSLVWQGTTHTCSVAFTVTSPMSPMRIGDN